MNNIELIKLNTLIDIMFWRIIECCTIIDFN